MGWERIMLVVLVSIPCRLWAQDSYSHFKAFGTIPTEVPSTLYHSLQQASSPERSLPYLDTIAQIFLKAALVDSVVAYGHLMQVAVASLRKEDEVSHYYQRKAFYYEGMGKREMGLLEDAVATFMQGMALPIHQNDRINDHLKLGLAETYLLRREFEKAHAILTQLDTVRADTVLALSIKVALGNYYLNKDSLSGAAALYQQVINAPGITYYPQQALRAQINLGLVTAQHGDIENAISAFRAAKEDALYLGLYDLYIKATLNEGRMYAYLEDYPIAEAALNMAYINAVSWNRLMLQRDAIRALVNLYATREDYKNAYNLMTQDAAISRIINTKQNKLQLRDLEFKYETLQKERKIDTLEKAQLKKQAEINRQKTIKNAVLIGFFAILAPIILLLVVYYQKLQTQSLLNRQQEELNKQEVQSLLQTQELQLARAAMAAQNEERDRIARELHDSIGGNLAAIKLQMNTLTGQHGQLRQILQQLDTTYDQVREISHSLIPSTIKNQAFVSLVSAYIENLANAQAVQLDFSAYPEDDINALDKKIQVTLFNLIKELITNAFKHARAKLITIQLNILQEEADNALSLLYEDDGVGFDPDKATKGIGLKNMIERVTKVHGTIAIDSKPQRGAVISIRMPTT